MTIPLSTKSYNHYAGADNLSVYPITFPTYEADTVKAYVTNIADWSHIAGELTTWAHIHAVPPAGFFVHELVLSTDYTLQNINRSNTSITLLDASAVPPGWIGPIPARQEWLTVGVNAFLSEGYYLFVEFISNPMRPSVLSSGNQLLPALTKDLDRTTMHVKALDHKVDEVATALDTKMTEGLEFLDDKVDENFTLLNFKIDQNFEILSDRIDEMTGGGGTDEPYDGFSLRYGETVSFADDHEALLYILQLGYLAAGISLSCSPGQGIREKGTLVSSVTMNATTTKNTNDITAVEHYRNGVIVENESAPAAGGGVESFVEGTPFTDNMSFYSRVHDGTNWTNSNTVTYSYVYPYYEGKGAAGLDAAGIVANLDKVVRASTGTVSVTTSPASEHFYFCYPTAYPALVSILDMSDFETINDYFVRTVNITGLDGSSVSYRVYEFKLPTTQVDFTNKYIR
jgi:hypothetical protein